MASRPSSTSTPAEPPPGFSTSSCCRATASASNSALSRAVRGTCARTVARSGSLSSARSCQSQASTSLLLSNQVADEVNIRVVPDRSATCNACKPAQSGTLSEMNSRKTDPTGRPSASSRCWSSISSHCSQYGTSSSPATAARSVIGAILPRNCRGSIRPACEAARSITIAIRRSGPGPSHEAMASKRRSTADGGACRPTRSVMPSATYSRANLAASMSQSIAPPRALSMLNSTNFGTPPDSRMSGRPATSSSSVSGSASLSRAPSARRSSPTVEARRWQACRIRPSTRSATSWKAANSSAVMIGGRIARHCSFQLCTPACTVDQPRSPLARISSRTSGGRLCHPVSGLPHCNGGSIDEVTTPP